MSEAYVYAVDAEYDDGIEEGYGTSKLLYIFPTKEIAKECVEWMCDGGIEGDFALLCTRKTPISCFSNYMLSAYMVDSLEELKRRVKK